MQSKKKLKSPSVTVVVEEEEVKRGNKQKQSSGLSRSQRKKLNRVSNGDTLNRSSRPSGLTMDGLSSRRGGNSFAYPISTNFNYDLSQRVYQKVGVPLLLKNEYHNSGAVRLEGREWLCNAVNNQNCAFEAAPALSYNMVKINPYLAISIRGGSAGVSPLAGRSSFYSRYAFRSLRLTFQAANPSTSQGAMVMGYEPNPNSCVSAFASNVAPFTDYSQVIRLNSSVASAIWKPNVIDLISNNNSEKTYSLEYSGHTTGDPFPSSNVISDDFYQGIMLANIFNGVDTTIYGFFMIEYVCDLYGLSALAQTLPTVSSSSSDTKISRKSVEDIKVSTEALKVNTTSSTLTSSSCIAARKMDLVTLDGDYVFVPKGTGTSSIQK